MFNNNLYNFPYHKGSLSEYKFLVTGGAGFIGSNLVEYLLKYQAGHVRVLDNLSNGYFENISNFVSLSNFEFINGDIRDIETCRRALSEMDFVSHQAALGSVPRSINDPMATNEVNISGFLNVLISAKEASKLKQLVYAASSSTYGDNQILPKVEGNEGNPLSPYAVTKLVNELYADVFSKVYNFHTIGLRYFNVFGPKQNPRNPYAAVIPKFIECAISHSQPTINGDGSISRDFTFIENVVQANIKALLLPGNLVCHEVLNIAVGQSTTLKKLWDKIVELSNDKTLQPIYNVQREGDILHSLADISKAQRVINYYPLFDVFEGLKVTFNWIKLLSKK